MSRGNIGQLKKRIISEGKKQQWSIKIKFLGDNLFLTTCGKNLAKPADSLLMVDNGKTELVFMYVRSNADEATNFFL